MSLPTAVHQLLPTLSWGDAVGNMVRAWQAALRSWGFESEIFAGQTDERCRDQARPGAEYPARADARTVLIVHHSIESGQLPMLRRAPGRKAVVYHNITPSYFFEGHDRRLAQICRAAREELYQLASIAERGYAYARFSGEELTAAGFSEVDFVPFLIDWEGFDTAPDPALLSELDDGCTNVLFVGRGVPNKRLDDVLRVFTAYQRLYNPRSRLVVAGALDPRQPYVAWLQALQAQLKPERVRLLGRVSQAQLSACYQSAGAYLSMSQHEGFGVPLLEAMHRGVPVVAYAAAAVPETMGGAGIASLTRDPLEVARLLAVLDRNGAARERMIARQRRRAAEFSREKGEAALRRALAPLLEGARPKPPPPRPDRPGVQLVCPTLDVAPEHPLSLAARSLAVQLAARCDVEVLTLKADGWPAGPGPEVVREGLTAVLKFSPELPLEEGFDDLPHSSSLQSAVLAARDPVVFFGTQERIARFLLPDVLERAFGVDGLVGEGTPEAEMLGPRRHGPSADGGLEEAVQAVAAQVLARVEKGGSRAR